MINPYFVFHGQCREALAFYQAAFGGESPQILPYGEYVPQDLAEVPAGLSEWVMHAEMVLCGTKCWFADEAVPPRTGNAIKLAAAVPSAGEAGRLFGALSQGGSVTLPPTETFYSTFHAAVVDRFGVEWNVTAEEAPGQQR